MSQAGPADQVTLTIDLDAVAANYRTLQQRLDGVPCAAAVKADAYGLGVDRVAPTLWHAGCRHFFVATLDEAVALRGLLPDADISPLNGLSDGGAEVCLAHRLLPILNHLGDIESWRAAASGAGRRLGGLLHIDTGMARLGLPEDEVARVVRSPDLLDGVAVRYVMSHLACADEPDHPLNRQQLDRFADMRRRLAPATGDPPGSLANSSGIFLGPEFHADLGRPGAAIYGLAPAPDAPNPMAQVINLKGKIVQVRDVDSPMTVGYGATHRVARRGRVATLTVGYADGFLRSLSNQGSCFIGDIRVPLIGRVSMDLITVDVSDIPADQARIGTEVELIGPHQSPDALAADAGTIGYEILTALGARYHRHYIGGPS